jgi:DNA-binding transcriptional ArsR family regulator
MVTKSSAVFRAVADSTRRRILDRLRRGPAATGRIAREFPVSRPAISRHLRVLERAGLVRGKRVGRTRVYALDPAPLRRIEEWIASYRGFAGKSAGAPAAPIHRKGTPSR